MNPRLKSFGALILIGISLGLNVWLLIRWTRLKSGPNPENTTIAGPVVVSESVTRTPPHLPKEPFDWSTLESPGYPQYAKNIRGFGCPEPVVKIILQRDISAYYLDRRTKELAPLLPSFWDFATNDLDHARSMVKADIEDAETTVDSLLMELIQARRENPIMTRIRRRTARFNDARLNFLSPDIREKLIAIEHQPDVTNSTVSRADQIAQLLTSYELQEYRLRSSSSVRSLLNTSYVDAPAASLKEIVARYCNQLGFEGDVDRSKLKEIVRSVLGDQAAQVYELSYSRDYRTIYALTRQTQPDPSVAILVYNLQQQVKKLLESQPDSAATIVAEARRQILKYVSAEQADVLFDQLHFPNL